MSFSDRTRHLPPTLGLAALAAGVLALIALSALLYGQPLLGAALGSLAAMMFWLVRRGFGEVLDLARQSEIDSLSRLPNRRSLRRALRRAAERGQAVTLALIDLDGFKAINDNYGHAVGDRLIRAVSDTLRGIAGSGAMVARLGGDEFALLAHGEGAGLAIETLAEMVLARLTHPFYLDDRTLVVGASIGIADRGDCDAIEMLRRADVAMYAAKHDGRMRANRYDADLDARQAAKHNIELELRAAIADEAFGVVYQPLFASDRRRITGVEALVRWTSPTLGEVRPEVFVPIAEESGLIDRIGLFVLRRACTEALAWPELRLAVNVSAAQLRNPDFPRKLRQVLAETGYPPTMLEVEITETYLVREAEGARRVLAELRALGVSVSLDDFGTGFASIGFLRQFTFDKLKIDRSLVADAEHSEAARALVQASVAVARALDMPVTAEGVETTAQADLMNIVGCDELQGWLFARASNAEGIGAALAATRADPSQRRLGGH
ncbi:MAG: bifunctional diguanylate cyclase/phosphodiesterase [Sphingomonadaceae bacterium]|nr:bifunctional diguanylate cyclase/phosphodiesterase [Sphingomonadaceae bacterium]